MSDFFQGHDSFRVRATCSGQVDVSFQGKAWFAKKRFSAQSIPCGFQRWCSPRHGYSFKICLNQHATHPHATAPGKTKSAIGSDEKRHHFAGRLRFKAQSWSTGWGHGIFAMDFGCHSMFFLSWTTKLFSEVVRWNMMKHETGQAKSEAAARLNTDAFWITGSYGYVFHRPEAAPAPVAEPVAEPSEAVETEEIGVATQEMDSTRWKFTDWVVPITKFRKTYGCLVVKAVPTRLALLYFDTVLAAISPPTSQHVQIHIANMAISIWNWLLPVLLLLISFWQRMPVSQVDQRALSVNEKSVEMKNVVDSFPDSASRRPPELLGTVVPLLAVGHRVPKSGFRVSTVPGSFTTSGDSVTKKVRCFTRNQLSLWGSTRSLSMIQLKPELNKAMNRALWNRSSSDFVVWCFEC